MGTSKTNLWTRSLTKPAWELRRRLVHIALIALTTALVGCATQTLKQGHDLSAAGVAYADAIVALIDATPDPVIESDSVQLLRDRQNLPSEDHKKKLTEYDDKLLAELTQMGELKRNTLLVKAYFTQLQALADSTAATDSGAALKDLGGAINSAN